MIYILMVNGHVVGATTNREAAMTKFLDLLREYTHEIGWTLCYVRKNQVHGKEAALEWPMEPRDDLFIRMESWKEL